MFRTKWVAPLTAACVLFLATPSPAPAAGVGERHCADLAAKMELMVGEMTSTSCIATPSAAGWTFALVAAESVFLVETARKPYLLSSVGVFGLIFNHNRTKTEALVITDWVSMNQGRGWRLESALARRLQREVKAGQLTLDQMYAALLRNLEEVRFPGTD